MTLLTYYHHHSTKQMPSLIYFLSMIKCPGDWNLTAECTVWQRTATCPINQVLEGLKGRKSRIFSSRSFLQETNSTFITMKPQVDLFLMFFWRKLKTLKRHFEITWPLARLPSRLPVGRLVGQLTSQLPPACSQGHRCEHGTPSTVHPLQCTGEKSRVPREHFGYKWQSGSNGEHNLSPSHLSSTHWLDVLFKRITVWWKFAILHFLQPRRVANQLSFNSCHELGIWICGCSLFYRRELWALFF